MVDIRNYAIVTSAYWGFTLTDGALRMLVLLHFHTLGYSPLELAFLFMLYEFFGVVTNLIGGWIGSRFGLRITLYAGLSLQVFALWLLSQLDPAWSKAASVAFVVAAQGLSGIAKDLTKMSSKSAIKLVVPDDAHSALFKWVAVLTGSKNALKGAGFFMGGLLLAVLGFELSLWAMAAGLVVILGASVLFLQSELGKSKAKVKFTQIFSKSRAINLLSAARFFLFGARDVWFVVGVPIFLYDVLGWTFTEVGGFMAAWVIGYGVVQAAAPGMVKRSADGLTSETRAAQFGAFVLAAIPIGIVVAIQSGLDPAMAVVGGLALFGIAFAVNSSVHSYLILTFTDSDKVALNVGFYYMANAGGRLVGSLLSGLSYQLWGLSGCLLTASALLAIAGLITILLSGERRDVVAGHLTD
ncbi:MAG: organoarsenical effux MFS transporter ArsJ [Rhodospirillaceae bacterium]|nr:organoarsenical effux MFS transporter ArsJ [Rhodospirillaceae bacterium]MDD9917128.1 organoarsenical effux MFS transporter ArsJ [Rhodospirillaceae bacterium]MDD9927103.1 organoarsenical effux MFS transporter ArsJ [Rhodospirillaceae bacterium]